jgi:hypothetical protein
MPATIRTSPSFAQRGFALIGQSAVEQTNGLVEVSCEFVTTPDRADAFDRLFSTDAPPPINPTCVNINNLLKRRLYMVSRQSTKSNGFVYVTASYAGAMPRRYAISVDREFIVNWIYRIELLQQTFEFVRIGDATTMPAIDPPTRQSLTKIVGRVNFLEESKDGFLDYIKWLNSKVIVIEKPAYVTPNVQVIQRTFYID